MSATERMIRVYDRTMPGSNQRRYYDNSGYFNFGYWAAGAKSQREACDALVDQLTARIAADPGRILDVACGLGASTRRLAQSYAPDMVTGINISRAQIAEAQARTPGCAYKVMDATQIDFPDCYFGAVICVEAAFHFDTRDKFLKEAHRVLKPGDFSQLLSDHLPCGVLRDRCGAADFLLHEDDRETCAGGDRGWSCAGRLMHVSSRGAANRRSGVEAAATPASHFNRQRLGTSFQARRASLAWGDAYQTR
jgi:SAM-dependent methyltransferase